MTKSFNFVKPVVYPAVIFVLLILAVALSWPTATAEFLEQLLGRVTRNFGWLYLLAVAIFLIFMLAVMFTKMGNIKLGPDHSTPDYSYKAWFAMLFSVGTGVAIIFYGAAEPILQYANPPQGQGETIESAKNAMQIAFFHWGFHTWAIYGIIAMILAYFSFRHGMPLSLRTPLKILFGDRMDGAIGHGVDAFAVLCTLFGASTSVGFSVAQIGTGLHYINGNIPDNFNAQFILISAITFAALIVIKAGMNKGMKFLTMFNVGLVVLLMLAVFALGPTRFILQTFFENTGQYLNTIVARTFDMQAYNRTDWIAKWTLFLFAWHIAWAPVIGLFIAKISRGRTIREFTLAVLIIPSLIGFFWFSIFGNTALHMIIYENFNDLVSATQLNQSLSIFTMYGHMPLSLLLSVVTMIVLMTCFIANSVSAPLMLDAMTNNGQESTFIQKGLWTILIPIISIVLIYTGGLDTLKTVALISALPFVIIMLVYVFSFAYALKIEYVKLKSLEIEPLERDNDDQFSKRIAFLVAPPNTRLVEDYILQVAYPAMQRITNLLNRQEWPCTVTYDATYHRCFLQVKHRDLIDFHYGIRLRMHDLPEFTKLGKKVRKRKRNPDKFSTAEVFLRQGGQGYNVYGFSEEEIMDDVLKQFERELNFIENSPGLLPWRVPIEEADIKIFNPPN